VALADLGSGGGLPGLVVACSWEEARVTLIDSSARRTAFLERASDRLDLGDRVQVVNARAEACGREKALRGTFDGVTARSFGRPPVVAECAAPLLKVGGWLLVSEPPPPSEGGSAGVRWPEAPLRQLGLVPQEEIREEFRYQVLRQVEPCPERFPRRVGVPAKRPLF
jgi:16S rRNA (guanine527-N7)-methyltransferase